jgi:hypothetical protein
MYTENYMIFNNTSVQKEIFVGHPKVKEKQIHKERQKDTFTGIGCNSHFIPSTLNKLLTTSTDRFGTNSAPDEIQDWEHSH